MVSDKYRQVRFLGNTFSATADCREVAEHKKVGVVPGMAKWVQWRKYNQ